MAGRLLAGRYRLLSVVGRGGMGTVWRAADETLDREVAVKEVVLPNGLADDERENRHRRTLREARASARLGHPGVVTVHDVVDEDGRPWIVMELVRGRSLQDILDEDGPLAPARVAAIGRQVIGALRAAHAIGVLHRDVKPANVLVTGDDRAVLTDFGIAQVAGDATLTGTGMVMGSPAYMSPERVKGDAALPASDLWALGATLYAACEGKAPHHRSDAMAVLAAVMTLDAPPPRNAGPLAPVLMGLLERDPAARTGAQQAEEALAAVADGRAASPAAPASDGTALDGTALDGTAASRAAAGRTGAATAVDSAPVPAPVPAPIPVPDPPGGTGTIGFPDAPTAPPHPDPHVTGPARKRAGGRARTPLVIAGALAVAAVVAVGAFLLRPDGGESAAGAGTGQERPRGQASGDASGAPGTPAAGQPNGPLDGPSTQVEASPSTPAPAVIPPNFKREKGPGYTIGVPQTWVRNEQGRGIVWNDPATGGYVQVDPTPWHGEPYRHWEVWEQQAITDGNLRAYERVSLTRSTVAGHPAADIEFTWIRAGETTRARDRGVVIDGRSYAIVVALPASRWNANTTLVNNVLDTFRPTGVG
ncbi:serine/threonine-protein kinase [Actinomadura rifamycini]|uniref:serine/threonine-protein kinase n=1 Tax=Actinomadura rifamycini TaxID=31962 RepID=UPI00040081B4|nr:serine/threonine-protein kinase [Actinomadura rifamycini]